MTTAHDHDHHDHPQAPDQDQGGGTGGLPRVERERGVHPTLSTQPTQRGRSISPSRCCSYLYTDKEDFYGI